MSGQSQAACFSSINQLVLAEAAITDTSAVRTYVFCPYLLYSIGTLDYYDMPKEGGQAMIPLRPNMVLKCGYVGRRDGACLIAAGDLFLDGTSYHGVLDNNVDGVVIEGFTFVAPGRFAAEFTKPGNVEFIDCIFKDAKNATGAVLADYYNPTDLTSQLSVKFYRCDFLNNTYSAADGQAALVIGNSMQNSLIFDECKFSGNNMIFNNTNYETNSYLIESSGPIQLVGNCFDDNDIGVAPVGVYNDFFASNNYGSMTTAGAKCSFAAKFNDPMRFELFTPECALFDVIDACGISGTFAPIGSPTNAPSDFPSSAPVTESPTSSTKEPTESPTEWPTEALSEKPSRSPFAQPSAVPSISVTPAPTAQRSSSETIRYGSFATLTAVTTVTVLASCL